MSGVKSVAVSGYKSIRELPEFALHRLNVLIGANGAGKSNFINLFRLLNEMYEQQLQLYVQKQGGPDALLHFGRGTTESLNARFDFAHAEFPFVRLAYDFSLVPTLDNRLVFGAENNSVLATNMALVHSPHPVEAGHSESKLRDAADGYSLNARKSVGNWRVYHFHDTSDTAKVKQRHAANDNLRLKTDAANLGAYLRMLRMQHGAEYRRIVETIRLVMPFFGDFVHREGEPEYVELEWTQQGRPDTPFKAHMLSDGSLRFICLVTLLLQPVSLLPDTVLIDEPELGLHPYAIAVLVDIFRQVTEDKQLIVSTQSVELVNALAPEDVVVVDQVDGASVFKRHTQEELAEWLQSYALGELWKRNVLGGRP